MEITNSCGNKIKGVIHATHSHMHMLYNVCARRVWVPSAKQSERRVRVQHNNKIYVDTVRGERLKKKRQYNVNNSGKNHALSLHSA